MCRFIRGFFPISIITIVFLFTSQSFAQVPANSFGISANFGSSLNQAGFLYTLSECIEVGAGLTFLNKSYTVDQGTAPDAKSTVGFSVYGAYYLAKGIVNPYMSIGLDYTGYPKSSSGSSETTSNDISFHLALGGQSFITKGLGIFAQIGIGYTINSVKTTGVAPSNQGTNTFNLFTSAVGAAFYFD